MDEGRNHKRSVCELCGYEFDCATGLNGATNPSPGMVSLCASCGAIGIFMDDTSVRLATDDEVRDIMASDSGPLVARAQKLIRAELGRLVGREKVHRSK